MKKIWIDEEEIGFKFSEKHGCFVFKTPKTEIQIKSIPTIITFTNGSYRIIKE